MVTRYNRGAWQIRCAHCGEPIPVKSRGYAPGDGRLYCGKGCATELLAWYDYVPPAKPESTVKRIRRHIMGIAYTRTMSDYYGEIPVCLRRKNGLAVDEAAKVLHEAGVIRGPWPEDLVEALRA